MIIIMIVQEFHFDQAMQDDEQQVWVCFHQKV